jgi:hypothetical protein
MKKTALLLGVIAAAGSPAWASVLSDKAASMAPGTWAELPTNGLTEDMVRVGAGHVLTWSDSGAWDPGSHQLRFMGGAHDPDPNKGYLGYDEATNTWTKFPDPAWTEYGSGAEVVWHACDHNAIDPVSGTYYYRPMGRLYIKSIALRDPNATWATLPVNMPSEVGVSAGLAYFPEFGGMIVANGWDVWSWKKGDAKWTSLLHQLSLMGTYQNFAEYNPVKQVVLCGGGVGSRTLLKVDASGQVTALNPAPFDLGIPISVITVDPVSGDYLVLRTTGQGAYVWDQFDAFDIQTQTWTSRAGALPIASGTNLNTGFVAAPISNYGVTLFLRYNGSNDTPKVFLYKHSAGGPVPVDPLPPARPRRLRPR